MREQMNSKIDCRPFITLVSWLALALVTHCATNSCCGCPQDDETEISLDKANSQDETPALDEQSTDTNQSRPALTASGTTTPPDSDLPPWVLQGNYRSNTNIDFVLVTVGPVPASTLDQELQKQLLVAANQYIDEQLQPDASKTLRLTLPYIERYLLNRDSYKVTQQTADGSRLTGYQQLSFTPAIRADLLKHAQQKKSQFRVLQTAFIGGEVLAFLGIIFFVFRINHATRGLHTGRLQFAAATAILALIVLGFYTGRFLPWV
jgi:hypothetical protein